MSREAMTKALEALENVTKDYAESRQYKHNKALTAIKAALAQPEQEPVAFFDPQSKGFYWAKPTKVIPPVTVDVEPLPLYTSPPQRTWVGLTDEAIWLEYQRLWPFHPAEEPTLAKDIAKFANVIEAKLKEKNT